MVQEAKQDPLIGTILEGRFFVERLLGEGGMGRVYVAEELRLKRRCALKVLLPELCADPGCVDRFLREARAIAQIHHENVVDIYHLGEDTTGIVFFAMELLVGEDLETRLADRHTRPLAWEQVCHYMLQVAAAMNSVHQAGLIHRDLKPSNIFLSVRRDGREQVKLLDFGIVKTKEAAALTSTGKAIGTAYYMSPEQILALPLDHRADIYSLGAVLFEAIAGRMPFTGEAIQVAMQHCNLPAPPLRQVAPQGDFPDDLAELVAHMLAKDPDDRIQTMDAVAQILLDIIPPHLRDALARPLASRAYPVAVPTGSYRAVSSSHSAASMAPTSLGDSSPAGMQVARRVSGPHQTQLLGTANTVRAMTPTPAQPQRPASTIEINLDTGLDILRPPGRARPVPVIPIAIGLVAAALLVLIVRLSRAPGPTAEPTPSPTVATPAPTAAPVRPAPPVLPAPSAPLVAEPAPPGPTPGAGPEPPDETPPRKPEGKSTPRVTDPLKAVRKGATRCRKQLDAVTGPKLKVDYVLASDGVVTSAKSDGSPLGKCLEGVLRAAKFPPAGSLRFLKIDL